MVLGLIWMIWVHSDKAIGNLLSTYKHCGFLAYVKSVSKSLSFIPSIKSYSLTSGDFVPNHILSPTSTVYLFYVNHVEWNKILYYFHVMLFGLGLYFCFGFIDQCFWV